MSFYANWLIAYEMFKQFMADTFGSGITFPVLCPEPEKEYTK